MDERQGRRVTGSGCEDEQKKGCGGGGHTVMPIGGRCKQACRVRGY